MHLLQSPPSKTRLSSCKHQDRSARSHKDSVYNPIVLECRTVCGHYTCYCCALDSRLGCTGRMSHSCLFSLLMCGSRCGCMLQRQSGEHTTSLVNPLFLCCANAPHRGRYVTLCALLQDAWVIHEGLGGQNNMLLAVFDGHGQEGDKVSRHVAATLPGLMANSSALRVCDSSTLQLKFPFSKWHFVFMQKYRQFMRAEGHTHLQPGH